MRRIAFLAAGMATVLAILGCSITIPTVQIKTGPVTETPVNVPRLADPTKEAYVTLTFGANRLTLDPGAEGALVQGLVRTNVKDFEPKVKIDGADIRVQQGNLEVQGIPDFRVESVVNDWTLKLGSDPIRLRISGGAYQGRMELGGLALTDLYLADGASDSEVSFSKPNAAEMASLRYETGASTVELSGLANANFSSMSFRSGAGTYTLDFGGTLKRDATVDVESGMSTLTVIVPKGTPAVVDFNGALSNINADSGWGRQGAWYVLEGPGPRLTIHISMGAGTVNLKTS